MEWDGKPSYTREKNRPELLYPRKAGLHSFVTSESRAFSDTLPQPKGKKENQDLSYPTLIGPLRAFFF